MSDYLAASIGLADGRILRIGPDEDQEGDIPTGFTFQTQIPGGFGPASISIPRPPDLYADDTRLFSDVVVYGEGMRVVYEGYITGIPQQGQDEIQLQMAGWSSVLDRIQNFRQVFVNQDFSQWSGPSPERSLEVLTSTVGPGPLGPNVEAGAETSNPALVLSVPQQDEPNQQRSEAWFDAGPGLKIRRFCLSGTRQGGGTFPLPIEIYFSDSGKAVDPNGVDEEFFLSATEQPYTNRVFTPQIPSRYVGISLRSSSAQSHRLALTTAAIYGNHQLLLSGPEPSGVYGSEAIAYMVAGTPLNLLPDSIEASEFVIPHLSFTSDTSVREAIEQINVLGGKNGLPNDWGVYEDRAFFWQSPGTFGKTWRVSKNNLVNLRSDGPDSVLRTAGVKVNYQNSGGRTVSVGPPNSFSDYETTDLLSIDANNPSFRIPGIHTESVGLTSQRGAINIGQVILNERNRLDWRGDLEIQGEVIDEGGKTYPAHRIRAGDQIIVQDDEDTRPRPINSTSYNHDNLSLTASLGAVPDRLDALLARLAAVTDLFI